MSYFQDSIGAIRVKPAIGGEPGLRNSQIGSLHSVSAHFSLRHDPALVVLPTGAGKTAVLMLAPYLLLSRRVLIITPSRFVRDQISRDFSKLKTLKAVDVVSPDLAPPVVVQNRQRVNTNEDWEEFRKADVVISTPNGASPAIKGIPAPPSDLFDLVLVDEAHHSPAPTWNALIASFPDAKVVLFTATPFRRDKKEIKAKYLYTYPIQRAFDDGIYGEMIYIPVVPAAGESADEALARRTEATVRDDNEKGFEHSLMIRADSRPRAKELVGVYERVTKLRLEVVDSSQSQRTAEKTVENLINGKIDGVICVDMLGEGFDLPRLKIAALHAPHRSLAVTLQFFGRFARVNGKALGDAKFLAVPSEMDGELTSLFEESESWGKKIRLLGQDRIGQEVEAKEFLEEFEAVATTSSATPDEDISLYNFVVFNHVKIHEVFGTAELRPEWNIPGFVTERSWLNTDRSTVVLLLREVVRPTWATTGGLDRIEHHLVVVHWDRDANLLFTCSTFREETFYSAIAASVVTGGYKSLSLNKTNRVLRAFSNLELFNVGIRNRATGTVAESYRQMAGSSADHALNKGDAALYHRGHIFGRGDTAKGVTTIGVSSLGKVWRLETTKIPSLIQWFEGLAKDIRNPAPFATGIAIDHFDVGVDIAQLPEDVPVIAADWSESVYKNPWIVTINNGEKDQAEVSLLDFDLLPDVLPKDPRVIPLRMSNGSFSTMLEYTIGPVPSLAYENGEQPRLFLKRNFAMVDALTYLNEGHLRFHLGDGSVLQDGELFPPMGDEELVFDSNQYTEVVNWDSDGVDVQKEFGDCAPKRSIHAWLETQLIGSSAQVILYDHRPGECADFLAAGQDATGKLTIDLFHCKKSGGPEAGDRTEDVFEVCGQAVKSGKFRNRKQLIKHVRARVADGSRMIKGELKDLLSLLESDSRYEVPLTVHIVQPGISRGQMSQKIATQLATTNRGLVSVGCNQLKVICSE